MRSIEIVQVTVRSDGNSEVVAVGTFRLLANVKLQLELSLPVQLTVCVSFCSAVIIAACEFYQTTQKKLLRADTNSVPGIVASSNFFTTDLKNVIDFEVNI